MINMSSKCILQDSFDEHNISVLKSRFHVYMHQFVTRMQLFSLYGYAQLVCQFLYVLADVIMTKNVQQLKEKLDKYRYKDRTTRV